MTVFGINEVVFDACDKENKDEMKSVLLKDILARNPNIANFLPEKGMKQRKDHPSLSHPAEILGMLDY